MQPLQPGGATAQGSVSKRDWAVQPPLSRGSTARAQVSSSAKRCNHRARSSSSGREVQPLWTGDASPELGLRALAERCNHLWQRGATTSGRKGRSPLAEKRNFSGQEMHRLSSVFELWQEGATTPDREGGTVRAQSSSSARRCHLSSREVQPPDPRILGFDRFDRFELEF